MQVHPNLLHPHCFSFVAENVIELTMIGCTLNKPTDSWNLWTWLFKVEKNCLGSYWEPQVHALQELRTEPHRSNSGQLDSLRVGRDFSHRHPNAPDLPFCSHWIQESVPGALVGARLYCSCQRVAEVSKLSPLSSHPIHRFSIVNTFYAARNWISFSRSHIQLLY